MARVKICGITRAEDAELAVELGAWAIGLILWPGSERHADPAQAAGIARHMQRRVNVVGVFVDPTLDEVAAAADAMPLTHLQLHGSVGPQFCLEAGRRTGCQVIRGFRIAAASDVQDTYRYHTDFHLFDAKVDELHGGSGQSFDWAIAGGRRSRVPLIVAGGLTPENVTEAIRQTHPYAVDVASGVETQPGVKDHEKLAAFIAAAASFLSPTAAELQDSEALL